MDNEVIQSLIENVNNNIFDYNVIEYTINIIRDYIYQIDLSYLINLIMKYIYNENFVINFLDRFLLETNSLQININHKIISQDLSISDIKNLLLLDNINDKFYFNLYFEKDFDFESKNELFEYIYSIGKLNNFINSLKKYLNFKSNKYLIQNLKCFINLFIKYKTDQNTFLELRNFINYFISNVVYIYIDTQNIINYLLYDNIYDTFILNFTNIDTIKYFIDFFKIENEYNSIYFDKSIILNQILYLKYMNSFNKNNMDNIIDLLSPLIDVNCNLIKSTFTELNKHEKYDIFCKMASIIINIKSDYIPENMITIILDFLDIDFLTWIKIDEFIKICELIFKLLIKIEKANNLFNLNRYDDFLYKLMLIENEILNNFELQINKEILFTNYSSIKTILYNYINILNIISHFEMEFIKKLNETTPCKLYGDLIYMLNLNINKYIILTENNNISKFSLNILIKNIIITKFIIINNQIDTNRYVNYGLEYDKIIDYYNHTQFTVLPEFVDKIKKIKNEESIINLNENLYEDNLFCVKIKNPYRLPSQSSESDFFERDMLRLLIREKQEDPYTRKPLTLKELDKYNECNENISYL